MSAERSLRDAEYDRLRESLDLGGTLVRSREPTAMRSVLERILANGATSLERAGDVADPYFLANTHMTLAAAEYDLAGLEDRPEARAPRVARGTAHAESAVGLALGSGTTLLSFAILPWALVVLAGGLHVAGATERPATLDLMVRCAEALPQEHERQKRDRIRGARTLFESQLLLEGARRIADQADRRVVLERAAEVARDARRILLGAGDRDAARQARETLGKIASA